MKRALALLLIASLSGCYRYHYKNPTVAPGATPSDGQWHHNFLYFLELDHVNLAKQCPQGWSQVDHQQGPFQVLAVLGGALILGALTGVGSLVGVIWQPTEVKVTCAEVGAPSPAAPQAPAPYAPPPPAIPTS